MYDNLHLLNIRIILVIHSICIMSVCELKSTQINTLTARTLHRLLMQIYLYYKVSINFWAVTFWKLWLCYHVFVLITLCIDIRHLYAHAKIGYIVLWRRCDWVLECSVLSISPGNREHYAISTWKASKLTRNNIPFPYLVNHAFHFPEFAIQATEFTRSSCKYLAHTARKKNDSRAISYVWASCTDPFPVCNNKQTYGKKNSPIKSTHMQSSTNDAFLANRAWMKCVHSYTYYICGCYFHGYCKINSISVWNGIIIMYVWSKGWNKLEGEIPARRVGTPNENNDTKSEVVYD